MSTAGAAVTGEQLVARCRDMVPALRERARSAEEAGRIPEETIEEMKEAGLFRAVVPTRYGGYEIGFRYIPQIFRELGRGCTSTAWTMGFLIYHNFQFGHFPVEAQDDVWADKGYTMAPGQVMPSGKAERVAHGYRLTGRWGYATGILHGDWMLLAAPVAGAEPPEVRRFFVGVADCKVLDTWHVSAMKATGSHDVELDGVFVPDHHSIAVADLRNGTAPGMAVNTGPLWRVPLLTLMVFGAVGPLLGGAEAVLEIVTDTLKTKVGSYSGAKLAQQMSTRVRLAEAKTRLDAIRGLFDDKIEWISETVAAGDTLSREQRLEMRMVVCHIARESHLIVTELARDAGSRAIFLDSPVQRFQRDLGALATHAIFDLDHVGDLYGGLLMGGDVPPDAMI